jgi:hypothetical protein
VVWSSFLDGANAWLRYWKVQSQQEPIYKYFYISSKTCSFSSKNADLHGAAHLKSTKLSETHHSRGNYPIGSNTYEKVVQLLLLIDFNLSEYVCCYSQNSSVRLAISCVDGSIKLIPNYPHAAITEGQQQDQAIPEKHPALNKPTYKLS